jgi:hypothetical protein
MRRREKVILTVIALFIFGELVKHGIAMRVIIFCVIGYQAYRWWKYK